MYLLFKHIEKLIFIQLETFFNFNIIHRDRFIFLLFLAFKFMILSLIIWFWLLYIRFRKVSIWWNIVWIALSIRIVIIVIIIIIVFLAIIVVVLLIIIRLILLLLPLSKLIVIVRVCLLNVCLLFNHIILFAFANFEIDGLFIVIEF